MNKATYYFERLYLSSIGSIQLPPSIEIDLTYSCTKKCYYCNAKHTRKLEDMASFDDYIKLLHYLPNLIKDISFAGGGEPMEREFAPDVIYTALQHNFKVGLTTTGDHLNKLKFNDKFKLSWVGVDIDSGNHIDYQKIGKGDLFNDLILSLKDNIFNLNNIGTVTTFKYLINHFNNSLDKIKEAIYLSKELNFQEFFIRVAFIKEILNISVSEKEIADICKSIGIKYYINLKKYRDYLELINNNNYYQFCYAPLFAPLFSADGQIYWCCEHRAHKDYVIGNWINDGHLPLLDNKLLTNIINFKDIHKCNSRCRYAHYNNFAHKVFTDTLNNKSGHITGFF